MARAAAQTRGRESRWRAQPWSRGGSTPAATREDASARLLRATWRAVWAARAQRRALWRVERSAWTRSRVSASENLPCRWARAMDWVATVDDSALVGRCTSCADSVCSGVGTGWKGEPAARGLEGSGELAAPSVPPVLCGPVISTTVLSGPARDEVEEGKRRGAAARSGAAAAPLGSDSAYAARSSSAR